MVTASNDFMHKSLAQLKTIFSSVSVEKHASTKPVLFSSVPPLAVQQSSWVAVAESATGIGAPTWVYSSLRK